MKKLFSSFFCFLCFLITPVWAQVDTGSTSGYNILIGPGLWNLNLGIRRVFSVTKRQKVEIRGEFYNALNHPNFGLPNADIDAGPGASGTITSLSTPMRTVQVALKYRL